MFRGKSICQIKNVLYQMNTKELDCNKIKLSVGRCLPGGRTLFPFSTTQTLILIYCSVDVSRLSIVFSFLRQYLVVVFRDKPLELWDIRTGTLLREMAKNFPTVTALVLIYILIKQNFPCTSPPFCCAGEKNKIKMQLRQ